MSRPTRKNLRPSQVTGKLLKFTGDSGSGGNPGLVPPPSSGDAAAGKFLKADGTWVTPPNTIYTSPVTTRGDIFIRDASADARLPIGAANTYLKSDGTDPSWVAGWTTVLKTADETLTGASSTTFQDDNHLTFAVAANTKYSWRVILHYNSPSAADFKYQFTGPASPTIVRYGYVEAHPGSTGPFSEMATAFSTSISLIFTTTTDVIIMLHGLLQNGSNAGNVTLQWAQNSSSGTTTVYAGSYLEWIKVA